MLENVKIEQIDATFLVVVNKYPQIFKEYALICENED